MHVHASLLGMPVYILCAGYHEDQWPAKRLCTTSVHPVRDFSGRNFLPYDWVCTSMPSNRLYTCKKYSHSDVLGMYGLWHGCTWDVITTVSYVHACAHGCSWEGWKAWSACESSEVISVMHLLCMTMAIQYLWSHFFAGWVCSTVCGLHGVATPLQLQARLLSDAHQMCVQADSR